MKFFKVLKRPKLKQPTMIACWPGMGNVGIGAVDYLRRKLKAIKFAELDISQRVIPEAVVIEKGLVSLPPPPVEAFYYANKPPVIFFESDTQLAADAGVEVMEEILEIAQRYKVKVVYTAAAFPTSSTYSQPSYVYAVANSDLLKKSFQEMDIRQMKGGQISGMNGLLLGYAARKNLEAGCLLATLPGYAVNLPNPKASAAIVRMFSRVLGIEVDMKEIEAEIRATEDKMQTIEKKMKEMFTAPEEMIESIELGKDEIPKRLIEKIEGLFKEARIDKSKAYLLKEELDRWKLYELYEDRFLDLFREIQ